MTPKPPRKETLKKYGLTEIDFMRLLEQQGGVCAICGRVPSRMWHIDHEHVRGYWKMTDERRRRHVRGLLCHVCNRFYVSRGMTVERAQAVVAYLQSYHSRQT